MIEFCYFSLIQWEIRIHLLWGKCFNIPRNCDPHLNQTKWLNSYVMTYCPWQLMVSLHLCKLCKALAYHSFSTIAYYKWARIYDSVFHKGMFWTNEKLSLTVAWLSPVSISCFKVETFIGHVYWFLDSANAKVTGANFWCTCIHCSRFTSLHKINCPRIVK